MGQICTKSAVEIGFGGSGWGRGQGEVGIENVIVTETVRSSCPGEIDGPAAWSAAAIVTLPKTIGGDDGCSLMLTTGPSGTPMASAYCWAFARARSTALILACSSTDSGSANENVTPPMVNPGPATCCAAS